MLFIGTALSGFFLKNGVSAKATVLVNTTLLVSDLVLLGGTYLGVNAVYLILFSITGATGPLGGGPPSPPTLVLGLAGVSVPNLPNLRNPNKVAPFNKRGIRLHLLVNQQGTNYLNLQTT